MLQRRQAIICDIDDTLIIGGKVNEPLANLLRKSAMVYAILLVTYRSEKRRQATMKQLLKHGIPTAALFMRRDNDDRDMATVKAEIYGEVIKPKWHVVAAIDDIPKVITMWKGLGIMCLQVHHGR